MPPLSPLEATAGDIRAMRVRGAAPIAVAAAKALAEHVRAGPADFEALRRAAREGAKALLASRPTAVSLRHGVHAVLGPALAAPTAALAREAAVDAARRFAADAKASEDAIARHGADAIQDGDRILTHCHSSTVVAVLAKAHQAGKAIEVVATETRPFRQGLTTARWLREAGVPTTLIVDSAALTALRSWGIARVLVGADTVTSDGSLFNKVGTSQVALAARSCGVPFWCAASWIKFTPEGPGSVQVEERDPAEVVAPAERPPGLVVRNPVFDRTPPGDVAAFVTERGVVPPTQAVRDALARLPREVPA